MDTQIVSLKTPKGKYEVVVKKGTIRSYREKKIGLDKTVVSDEVFSDAKAGTRAPVTAMLADLEVETSRDALLKVLEKGQCDLTTAERAQLVSEKRKEVVAFIATNYTDIAGKPLPSTRVESLLDGIKGLKIDPFAPCSEQAPDIVKSVHKTFPIKLNVVEGTTFVPFKYKDAADRYIKEKTTIVGSQKKEAGVFYTLRMPPGLYNDFIASMGKITEGYFEPDFPSMSGGVSTKQPPSGGAEAKGGKGRRGKK